MSTVVAATADASSTLPSVSRRANALAERLEEGARRLESLALSLSDSDWQVRIPGDGRKVGVVVHHVASMYPLEMQLALALAAGKPIEGVTWDVINDINAKHAAANDAVTRDQAVALLRTNSAAAAAGIRALTDGELDRAALVSLNADAPLTCQFFLEDHPVRHSYHHLAKIRAALAKARGAETLTA
ncbi:MAG TPA: DinB family protein [Vicinamibacterales bacterium]|nr:DinB family protein [Vicinamibacterales bacterium]